MLTGTSKWVKYYNMSKSTKLMLLVQKDVSALLHKKCQYYQK